MILHRCFSTFLTTVPVSAWRRWAAQYNNFDCVEFFRPKCTVRVDPRYNLFPPIERSSFLMPYFTLNFRDCLPILTKLLLILILAWSSLVGAEGDEDKENQPEATESNIDGVLPQQLDSHMWMILLFGGVSILTLTFIGYKHFEQHGEDIVHGYILIMIVTSTLVMANANIDTNELGLALGIYGTIIGYLLGLRGGKNNENCKHEGNQE